MRQMPISYLLALSFLLSSHQLVAQENKAVFPWGIHVGYSTQQTFPYNDKDYTLTQQHILAQFVVKQFDMGSVGATITAEGGYYLSQHQLINKWFTTSPKFKDFPENFQETMLKKKSIHQIATHLGIELSYYLTPKTALFGYAAIGPMYTSQQTERLAAGLAFSDNVGIGIRIKYNPRIWIISTVLFRHESNADLKFPNSGHNTTGIRLGVRFNPTAPQKVLMP